MSRNPKRITGNKDVRAEIKRLESVGWHYRRTTGDGHHIMRGPAGEFLMLPNTPGPYTGWLKRSRKASN